MIPLEVVLRFGVDDEGSYKKRNPNTPAGHRFGELIVELYLKTTDRKWKDQEIPCDDPLLEWNVLTSEYRAYLPHVPLSEQKHFLSVCLTDLGLKGRDIQTIEKLARDTGTVLDHAFKSVRVGLVDFKIEIGRTPQGKLVVADVISPDEWRAHTEISKQGFRKDEPTEITRARYQLAERLTRYFPK